MQFSLLYHVVQIVISHIDAFSPLRRAHALFYWHGCCVVHMQGGRAGGELNFAYEVVQPACEWPGFSGGDILRLACAFGDEELLFC